MPLQIMWNQQDKVYRGQASDGAVITIDEPALVHALKQAGNGIYEADWWRETLTVTLENWGIYNRRWTDDTTGMPRIHFGMGPQTPTTATEAEAQSNVSGPLSARLLGRKKDE